MAEHGLRPKKRFGQNFLVDRNTLDRIAGACGVQPGSNVLEIGAGLGTLTQALAATGARVVSVEADTTLQPLLAETLAGFESVELVMGDFLKIDLCDFLAERGEGKWTVAGNLPYYITSPILVKLIECRARISRMLVMVQREVADRLKAQAGTEDYGSLSVLVQFYCDVQSVMKVSRNVFLPAPDVDSELVSLAVRERPRVEVEDEALFFRIVRAAFGKRRKTLFNALSSSGDLGWDKETAREALTAAGIDGGRRGETLSIEEFARIAQVALQA